MPQARVSYPNARVMVDGRVRIPAQGTYVVPTTGPAYTEFGPEDWEVEPIAPAEPRWEPGDVVADADGIVFWRTESDRWRDVTGMGLEPLRPLVRLVPAT